MKNKKEHICKFCKYFERIAVFGDNVDFGTCQRSFQDRKIHTGRFGNVYACTGFKRKTIDKKPKYNCKDHCRFYKATEWFCDGKIICNFFKRKKIDKVKRSKTPKEKLKERFKKRPKFNDTGYSLHYEFKSGKYEGMTIKEVIDNDGAYIDFLINKNGFKINSEAVRYLHKVKKKRNKEREERQRKNQEESRKWKEHFDRKTQEDRKNENFSNAYGDHFNEDYQKYTWNGQTNKQARAEEFKQKQWYEKHKGKYNDPFEEFFKRFNRKKNGGYNYNSGSYQHSSKTLDKQHGGILGLNGKVQKSEIKSYWKKAALKHHPDKNKNSAASIEMMKKVNNAWDYFKKKYQL